MLVEEARVATAISVGVEPAGVPAGVCALGGGPAAFVELLREQQERRSALDVPDVDERAGWCVVVDRLERRYERGDETLLTLSNGWLATNGAPLLAHPASAPRALVSGIYDGEGPETTLLPAPIWHVVAADRPDVLQVHRVLDLHTGVLREELTGDAPVTSVRFEPLGDPGIGVLRAAATGVVVDPAPLRRPAGGAAVREGRDEDGIWMQVAGSEGGIVAVATQHQQRAVDGSTRLDRIVAYDADPFEVPGPDGATERLADASQRGFERLLAEHRAQWAARWADCDVVIEGDDALQQGVRFALFHLHGAAQDDGETAVGRGASPVRDTEVMCSGTRTCSCCRSSPRPARKQRAACSSTGCGACRRRVPPRRLWDTRVRGFPGNRPAAAETSRHCRLMIVPVVSFRSARDSSRITSSPTSRGPSRGTSTGPATTRSRAARVGNCSWKRPVTGHHGFVPSATGQRTSSG